MQLNRNLQSSVFSLMGIVNPYDESSYTKHAILLTSLTSHDIASTFASTTLQSPTKSKPPSSSPSPSPIESPTKTRRTDPTPTISHLSRQHDTTVLNTRRYLFAQGDVRGKEWLHACTLNLLYLFAVYEGVRVLFVFAREDMIGGDWGEVEGVLAWVDGLLKGVTEEEAEKYMDCIGFVVENVLDLTQTQTYLSSLQAYSSTLTPNTPSSKLLKKILQNRQIFLTNIKKPIQEFITEITKTLPEYIPSSKSLTALYKSCLSAKQLEYLKKECEDHFVRKGRAVLQCVRDAVENKDVFREDQEERMKAFQGEIVGKMPFSSTPCFGIGLYKKESLRKKEQFSVQAAFFILVDLYKYEEEFYNQDKKEDYISYHEKNEKNEWEREIMNMSVVGCALERLFSQHTIYFNRELLSLAKYFHIVLRMLECVPGLEVRKHEKSMIIEIQNIIEKLISYFFDELNPCVEELTENPIEPIMLINLTSDIKLLAAFLSKLRVEKRSPYSALSSEINQKLAYIVSAFFFSAWKCYEIYNGFWNTEQKNSFMLELDYIFRNETYQNFLEFHKKSKTIKIARRMNEYFGDMCSTKKQYYVAVKFYQAGGLNWKLIQAYNSWLSKLLCSEHPNMSDIREAITRLSGLGLTEQCRKWCYKFMDRIDENSQFISLLQDIVDMDRNQNKMIMKEIANLKYDKMELVQPQLMDALRKELNTEEWLCRSD